VGDHGRRQAEVGDSLSRRRGSTLARSMAVTRGHENERKPMDNTENIELHELETIERNLSGDVTPENNTTSDGFMVFSASGFMVFSASGFMVF
jgi:hypothetical protein